MVTEFRPMAGWPIQRWVVAFGAAGVAAVLIGVPTVMIPSRFFSRMTQTIWWEYPFWGVASLLTGLIAATFVRSPTAVSAAESNELATTASGGLLSAFAVGCPVCNKVVVAFIGVSGALQIWAPLQPFLGSVSLGLLLVALRRRLTGELVCTVPARADAEPTAPSSSAPV
jgi:hypothetical protein